MTLDEAINGLIKDKMCNETPIETCVKKPCPDCDCYTIIELKDLLPVLSDAKNEIELYKKALEMACATLSNFLYHHPENHIEEEMRGFLQKAREE